MSLGRPRIRIVTGKGGVGKTVISCAIALAEARAGRRVLLAEVNAGDQVATLIGTRPVGSAMREVLENLYLVDMNPTDAIREYALLVLRFETVYKAVFGNRLVRHFIDLVPSLGELTMLGKLWYHEGEIVEGRPRFDLIILDSPSTGHAISMLRSAQGVANTVPPGTMRDNCRRITEMLSDPEKTAMHIVTTPEEMPVNEAVKLEQAASDFLHLRLGTTFINHRMERLLPGTLERLEPWRNDPELAATFRALCIREGKVRAGDDYLGRLPARMLATACNLPRLARPTFERADVEELATVIGGHPSFGDSP